MVGLIALIALVALVTCSIRYRRRGIDWPVVVIMGVKHALLGVIALYGLLTVLAVGAGTTRAILQPVGDTMIAFLPDSQPPASRAGQRPEARFTQALATVTPPLPTPTPRVVVAQAPQPQVKLTPAALAYEAAGAALHTTLPPASVAHTPVPAPIPTIVPTATPEDVRSGCDPAYPDVKTCIPPGPPFDQGCAITDERRFKVLPPDPQGLDHDGDGIGCEPIT